MLCSVSPDQTSPRLGPYHSLPFCSMKCQLALCLIKRRKKARRNRKGHARRCAFRSLASAPASGAKCLGPWGMPQPRPTQEALFSRCPTSCPPKCERPRSRVAHQVQSHSVTSPLRRNSFMLIKSTRKADSAR